MLAKILKWESNELRLSIVDQYYWPKFARLNDNLLYMIGGNHEAKEFLEATHFKPKASINLIRLGPINNFVYQEISMGEAYRMHSACVVHKKTKSLYIIGGFRDGEWVSDISKLAFTKNE
jgi:hypothetical protein